MQSDLSRFEERKPGLLTGAVAEIVAGRRLTNWTAALLPQIAGLVQNAGADELGFRSRAEVEDYLLDGRLFRDYGIILEAVRDQLVVAHMHIVDLFGVPDDRAFIDSVTLVRGVSAHLTGNGFAQMVITCDELLAEAAAQGYEPNVETLAFLAA